MKKILKRVFCAIIVISFLLSSCSYKGNGFTFYVKYDDGKYIYHSNTRCPNLDGSFDDFGIYNLVDENGYIDPYAFCWLCMDDNLIEECQKRIDKSVSYTIAHQKEDSGGGFGGLNAIRFNHFTDEDWNDNEYIRFLRQYITDYNEGKIEDEDLDAYKGKIRGKFVLLSIAPYIGGGAFIQIIFLDNPDDVFSCWVYSTVDEEKKTVVSYSVHSIRLDDEKSELTKNDILEIIKEHPENKVW